MTPWKPRLIPLHPPTAILGRPARPTASGPLPGLLVAFAALAASAFMTGDRAAAESVVCSEGQWVAAGRTSNSGALSGIPCDEPKPGWIFDWGSPTPGHIRFVYDGDRVVAPYMVGGVVRTTIRQVQQGIMRPSVNQPVASEDSAYLYQAGRDNRAVRGDDGQCYREQRIRGQWRRSGAYGSDAEACRKASWNAYRRSQGLPLINPHGDEAFPSGTPPAG